MIFGCKKEEMNRGGRQPRPRKLKWGKTWGAAVIHHDYISILCVGSQILFRDFVIKWLLQKGERQDDNVSKKQHK